MWKGSFKGRLKETGASFLQPPGTEFSQQLEREGTVTKAWPWSFRELSQPSQPLWTSVEPANESYLASVMRACVSLWEAGWPGAPRLKWSSCLSFSESLWEVWQMGESLCPWLRKPQSSWQKKSGRWTQPMARWPALSVVFQQTFSKRSYKPTKSFPGRSRDTQKPTLKGCSQAPATLETCKTTQEKWK